jgi:hypothetical protein
VLKKLLAFNGATSTARNCTLNLKTIFARKKSYIREFSTVSETLLLSKIMG